MESPKTPVVIVGGGPAGLLLCQRLRLEGIASVVLEQRTRDHVLSRVRAGVLEWGSTEVLREAGVGARMDREGIEHDGSDIAWGGANRLTIDTRRYAGRPMIAYGQSEITADLYDAVGEFVIDEAENVEIHGVESTAPQVSYVKNGTTHMLECDYVAGCDGFHGVSRATIPRQQRHEFEKSYPFGWLGILSETPPVPELVYANSVHGFALCSMRNPALSRYYVQCDIESAIEDWPDERFWTELKQRLPRSIADGIVEGPSVEKSIAPLRSFVCEPMQHGRLFLAGDAAHIVPPTGAKGLNLAISDVFYLSRALVRRICDSDEQALVDYSATALRRVWSAVRFSWWLTNLLHRFPDQTDFDLKIQERELDYLASSESYMKAVAEQYSGIPL